MIRYVKHNQTDYIIIDGSIGVDDIKAPVQVQVNLKNLTEDERKIIFRISSVAFNRHIDFTKKAVEKTKKSWWKVW